MPAVTDRISIANALRAFASQPLEQASTDLFKSLGYSSERTLDFGSVGQFLSQFDEGNAVLGRFNPLENWLGIKLLFQLTSADIAKGSSQQLSLLDPEPADFRKIESYLFLAIDLKTSPDCRARNRTELCDLARAINRLFPMPALILLKEDDRISIAITYRRTNKKDQSKDVVGRKVTLIKDISTRQPHPGHLAILEDFALPTLSAFRGRDIKTFADLDAAWRESLSVELLRRRAYRMLADWYFWAREHAQFPPDAKPDADGKPSLHLIRLLTRVIFCWFVKEKTLPGGRPLIPYDLFDAARIRETLKDATPDACTYYTAVLQNLFFATLNTEMDEAGKPVARRFARKVKEDHMVHTLWRHEDLLCDPSGFTALLRDVPFLNGGLFECLDDRVEIEGSNFTKEIRVDGFSTDPAKQPRLPNFLFFGEEQTADLSEATGSNSRSSVQVAPLLTILNRFVWTITESTPLEEEVALDPDLLGNVFENLLAAYNPETGTVARNATGSFYTPDYVVDWMIEQALQPLLVKALPPKTKNAVARIRRLLDWNEPSHDFIPIETGALIEALSKFRAIDPACGSGAFPMGLLKKAVRILSKLDPQNILWKQKQIEIAEQLESATAREEALAAIDRAFSRNNDDYGRKLYLIENGLYGVDIQPLAVQIVENGNPDLAVFAWQPGPSKIEFPEIFDQHSFPLTQRDLKPSGWRLESPVEMRLLERIRSSGTPLGEYCKGRFYYGIKTGFNEAFVVDRDTRDRLIAEHPSSEQVLKPFLRGRDVKRWRCEFAEQYLVKIESSENVQHPWSSKTPKEAERLFSKCYPAIHAFFEAGDNRAKLINRYDQGKFFWELRSCAYWKEFQQEKIVVPAIQDHVRYAPDKAGFYSNDKTSILIPPSVPFVLSFLNSQISWWITQQEFASKQGGFYEFKPMYVSKLPIPAATPEQQQACEALSNALIHLHRPESAAVSERGLMVAYFEQWLNGLVYELFFPGDRKSVV